MGSKVRSLAVVTIMLVFIATIALFVVSVYSNHNQSFSSNEVQDESLHVIYDTPASGSDADE